MGSATRGGCDSPGTPGLGQPDGKGCHQPNERSAPAEAATAVQSKPAGAIRAGGRCGKQQL